MKGKWFNSYSGIKLKSIDRSLVPLFVRIKEFVGDFFKKLLKGSKERLLMRCSDKFFIL